MYGQSDVLSRIQVPDSLQRCVASVFGGPSPMQGSWTERPRMVRGHAYLPLLLDDMVAGQYRVWSEIIITAMFLDRLAWWERSRQSQVPEWFRVTNGMRRIDARRPLSDRCRASIISMEGNSAAGLWKIMSAVEFSSRIDGDQPQTTWLRAGRSSESLAAPTATRGALHRSVSVSPSNTSWTDNGILNVCSFFYINPSTHLILTRIQFQQRLGRRFTMQIRTDLKLFQQNPFEGSRSLTLGHRLKLHRTISRPAHQPQ